MEQGWSGRWGKWLGAAGVACVVVAVQMLEPSHAAEAVKTAFPAADAKTAEKIKAALSNGPQAFQFSEVTATPIAGVYRVQIVNGPVLYTSEDGQHFVAGGEMYSVVSGDFVNLQEREFKPKRVEMMAAVDAKDQIIFSPKGETKAYINVFTDVDCGYCRKLHQEVPAMNALGIEVRYLAYPRSGLKGASYDKVATAWCADDPQTTLTRLKNREAVEMKVCQDNPVAEQMELGVKVGVSGTPSLVLADGSLIPGYQSAEQLAQSLGLK